MKKKGKKVLYDTVNTNNGVTKQLEMRLNPRFRGVKAKINPFTITANN